MWSAVSSQGPAIERPATAYPADWARIDRLPSRRRSGRLMPAIDQSPVEIPIRVADLVEPVVRLDASPSDPPHRIAPRRIVPKLEKRARRRLRIRKSGEQPRVAELPVLAGAALEQLAAGADVRGHDRNSAGHRFQDHHRLALAQTREHGHVQRLVKWAGIGLPHQTDHGLQL